MTNAWSHLHNLLKDLERRKVDYSLRVVRPDVITVMVAVPGERWEIEIDEEASIEVERFITTGTILDKSSLEDLWILAE